MLIPYCSNLSQLYIHLGCYLFDVLSRAVHTQTLKLRYNNFSKLETLAFVLKNSELLYQILYSFSVFHRLIVFCFWF